MREEPDITRTESGVSVTTGGSAEEGGGVNPFTDLKHFKAYPAIHCVLNSKQESDL